MADLIPIRQESFAAGEITPELQGRTDWQKYGSAAKVLRNWIAAPTGPVLNRPGTRFVALVDQTLVAKKWRLIPFYFSNDTAYQIVVTDHLMRVYTQAGVFLSNIPTVGAAVPYTSADLEQLKWQQFGNLIVLTKQGQPPAYIRRIADNNWFYTPENYAVTGFLQSGYLTGKAAVEDPSGSGGNLGRFLCPMYNSGQAIGVGDYLVGSDLKTYMSHTVLALNADPNPAVNPGLNVEPAIDAAHPSLLRQYSITIEWQDTFGDIHESGPVWSSFVQKISCYTDRPVTIDAGGLDPARPANFSRITTLKYYKGFPGALGFIGESPVGSEFQDAGLTPDFTHPPPIGTDPSQFVDPTGATFEDYPATVVIADERLGFANFSQQPQLLKFSEIGNFGSFDEPPTPRDDAPFEFSLLSDTLNDIRSLIWDRTLLAFCGSSEWSIKSDGPFSPTAISPRRQSKYGSSWLTPIVVGDRILFVTILGTTVREIEYDVLRDKLVSKDLSLYAQHLFTDTYSYLCDWAYADIPYKIVWGVRTDGYLVGMTYSNEQEVVAWHHHDTTGGTFLAVSTVPSGTETGVFFLVDRNGLIFLEKFASRIMTDQRYSCFLDCSFQFDGHVADGSSLLLQLITTAGQDNQITKTGGGADFTVNDVGSQIVFFPDGPTTYKFTVTDFIDRNNLSVVSEQDIPADIAPVVSSWAWARLNFVLPISNFDGMDLAALADGADVGTVTVAVDHSVTLGEPAVVVQVGIPYNADVELLDARHPNAESTVMTKLVKRVWIETNKTRGLQIGESYDSLLDVNQREALTPAILLPDTKKLHTNPKTSWNTTGSIIIRQPYPLPATILSVVREVEFGGT